jgi:hypothetical protein
MKSTIPWLIAAVVGTVMIVAYFLPYSQNWEEKALVWFDILAAFAFVLGGANLFAHHLRKISDQRAGWGFSAVTLISFLITLVVGMLKIGVLPADQFPEYPWSGAYQDEGGAPWWLYTYVYTPLVATTFSLLAFYVASAAFRAFRAKNAEATLLLATAFIVLLGRTYAGAWLTSAVPEEYSALTFPGLTAIILGVFNTAGQRAIMMGIALGIAATSLKVLTGVDRSFLGSDGD